MMLHKHAEDVAKHADIGRERGKACLHILGSHTIYFINILKYH